MRHLYRAVAVAAVAVCITVPSLGAAQASGNDWKTLSTFNGGRIQACKVATTKTGPWKVKLRVDARGAKSKVNGSAYVTEGADDVDHWKSGWVSRGDVSAIGTVRLPRGSAYALNAGLATANAGNGATVTAGRITGC
jgi:hypothetical protein